ncbi:MAG TPA: hypothetical protein VE998_10310 [Terriglobales bacterium]|nr:hypothetical protein [Terriglobales bacterium]
MRCASSPYRAEIEQLANHHRPGLPLFRYVIRDHDSEEVVFDGVAGDMREAIDSVNAWLDYLEGAAAA